MNGVFRSLGVRNVRVYFAGQLVSQGGTWLTWTAQVLLVLELTGSGVSVGVLTACQFGPALLLAPWAGVVSDRSDKRVLLMVISGAGMAQSFALAALAFADGPPVWGVYALAAAGGAATAFDNPARRSLVLELVAPDVLQNAVSLTSAMMGVARIVGPATAGVLFGTVGVAWCFVVDGVSYVAVIGSLWRLDTSQLHRAPVAVRARGQIRAGYRYACKVPEVWIPLALMTIVGTLSYNTNVVLPLFVTRSLNSTTGTFTVLFSMMSVGSVIGSLLVARRHTTGLPYVTRASILLGAALFALAAAPNVWIAVPFALALGIASITYLTGSTAVMHLHAAPEMRGRVASLQSMVFLGSTPIGGPLIGWVCDALGPRAGLGVGGTAAVLAGAAAARIRVTSVPSASVPASVAAVG